MADDPTRLAALTRGQTTVAGKIRALAAAGVPRADIARFLGKRYQHVRNVLEGDAQSGSAGQTESQSGYVLGKADLSGVNDRAATYRADEDPKEIDRRSPGHFWLRVRPDGSLPLPPEVLERLRTQPGERVFLALGDDAAEIIGSDTAMERARDLVRSRLGNRQGVVDRFMAEKRAMWGETDD
jgi:hypothetical protein